ncbi:VOC family protein [Virgibacillus necropolis]|uniref:VOC family protein n=1 Tax=Virgibacillus necropolis TaxID=163877 RepID=UPI00384C7CF3
MSQPILKGMEGVLIPVKDPKISAEWYEEVLGFKPIDIEKEAIVMKIAEESQTVVCLVRTANHQPMKFPDNNFEVGQYYNFIPKDLDETYRQLTEHGVKVNPIGGEGTFRYFSFYDPDGNPLGVCQ